MENNIDMEILKDFQTESKDLIEEMNAVLEQCEGDFSQVKSLERYGQVVDRIMGGAKSVAMTVPDETHFIHKIGNYASLCKAVSYKASQITDNASFYDIAVAFLLDATEILEEMVAKVDQAKPTEFKEIFSQTFLDRLRWISGQFGQGVRASVSASGAMNQNDIDALMKKLGI